MFDRWLIPCHNLRGSIVNLRVFSPENGGRVIATEGLSLQLYRLNAIKGKGIIYICEGEWDTLAMEYLRKTLQKPGSVIGVPGANVFKKEWRDLFNTRDICLCYDNDNAGFEGARRTVFLLSGVAQSVRSLEWPSTLPEGYDLRDYIKDRSGEQKEAWKDLHTMLTGTQKTSTSDNTKGNGYTLPTSFKPRTKFSQILRDFKKYYHVDRNTELALALSLAVTISIQIPGDPLWMFLVAPPGSGKTLILRTLEQSPYCIFRSSITPHSLISGFRDAEGDPSLIPQLAGKILVIKDYTEIRSLSKDEQEQIYGVLRGAYDGRAEKTFGNGITRIYDNCHFGLLAGVTDIIHGDTRATLGERFLKFQMLDGSNYDPTTHIERAIKGMSEQVEAEQFLRASLASYTDREIQINKIPKPPVWVIKRIISLSQIIAYLRAGIDRIGREIPYRPSPEVGTRLAKTLIKLGQSLAYIYDRKVIDKKIYAIMERVAFDTAIGWSLDILNHMMKYHPQPVLRESLTKKANIPGT